MILPVSMADGGMVTPRWFNSLLNPQNSGNFTIRQFSIWDTILSSRICQSQTPNLPIWALPSSIFFYRSSIFESLTWKQAASSSSAGDNQKLLRLLVLLLQCPDSLSPALSFSFKYHTPIGRKLGGIKEKGVVVACVFNFVISVMPRIQMWHLKIECACQSSAVSK